MKFHYIELQAGPSPPKMKWTNQSIALFADCMCNVGIIKVIGYLVLHADVVLHGQTTGIGGPQLSMPITKGESLYLEDVSRHIVQDGHHKLNQIQLNFVAKHFLQGNSAQ